MRTDHPAVIVGLFLAASLAACSNDDESSEDPPEAPTTMDQSAPAASESPATSMVTEPTAATETTEPTAPPASDRADSEPQDSTPAESAGTAASSGVQLVPVPPDGPSTITEFPIPADAEFVDLGPPLSGNWQFVFLTEDPESAIAFYQQQLGAQGYTFREDVQDPTNVQATYDLAFFGPSYGVVILNPGAGEVLVTVDDEPINGLTS